MTSSLIRYQNWLNTQSVPVLTAHQVQARVPWVGGTQLRAQPDQRKAHYCHHSTALLLVKTMSTKFFWEIKNSCKVLGGILMKVIMWRLLPWREKRRVQQLYWSIFHLGGWERPLRWILNNRKYPSLDIYYSAGDGSSHWQPARERLRDKKYGNISIQWRRLCWYHSTHIFNIFEFKRANINQLCAEMCLLKASSGAYVRVWSDKTREFFNKPELCISPASR